MNHDSNIVLYYICCLLSFVKISRQTFDIYIPVQYIVSYKCHVLEKTFVNYVIYLKKKTQTQQPI